MEKMKNWMSTYFTKRNVFRIVVLELQIIGLLLCVVLAMSVKMSITLSGDPVITIDKGESFVDPGAIARADGRLVDVDVQGTVDTNVAGTYTLCYRARFLLSSCEVTRTVHVVEPRPPVLTLSGQSQMTLTMGTAYVEPGCRATDCNGKDLSAEVEITGEVNVLEAGTYTVTYKVADEEGRVSTAQRIVTVEPAERPEVVKPEGKVIYLTFDDGPSPYTQRLLEILAKYDVKATFFVVGSNTNLDVRLNAIVDAGHSIGIHSMTHEFPEIYASEEAFLQDVYGVQDLIFQKTGVTTTLMRFPGGSSTSRSDNKCDMPKLIQTVMDLGFQYFDWNVDSKDAGGAKTADEVYQNVIEQIGQKKMTYACVLMHDLKSYSVDAVERIILWGLENGYTFLPLTENSPGFHH